MGSFANPYPLDARTDLELLLDKLELTFEEQNNDKNLTKQATYEYLKPFCRDYHTKGNKFIGSWKKYAKLNELDVENIRRSSAKAGILAEYFSVHVATILKIKQNKSWKHVNTKLIPIKPKRDRKGEETSYHKLTDDVVRNIHTAKGIKNTELAKRFNITTSCVSIVRTGKHWTHITGGKPSKYRYFSNTLCKEDIVKIFNDPLSRRGLKEKYNITQSTVERIKTVPLEKLLYE